MLLFEITAQSTLQSIFDDACRYFAQNLGQCVDDLGRCTYRNSDSTHCCVAGAFLGEEQVRQLQTTTGTRNPTAKSLVNAGVLGPAFTLRYDLRRLMSGLQACHDDITVWNGNNFIGHGQLGQIAKELNLTYTEPPCQS